MNYVEGLTIDEVYPKILKKLITQGEMVKPRGITCFELTGFRITLKDPLSRILYSPTRNINLMFAFAEFLWITSGSNKLDFIEYYNKKYKDFSDDGLILNGAYGNRIFKPDVSNKNQWDKILELLKKDPDSRQAVLNIHLPSDLNLTSKDIPCTCMIQFLIRNNKLNCITYMRSNDVIWGVPYDIFNFTLLQEVLAKQLGIQVGTYSHIAGSMHIYEYHLELAKNILDENQNYNKYRMEEIEFYGDVFDNIKQLIKYENIIRTENDYNLTLENSYWNNILNIIKFHNSWKKNDDKNQLIFLESLPEYYSTLLSNKSRKVFK